MKTKGLAKLKEILIIGGFLLVGGIGGLLFGLLDRTEPRERTLTITASKYAYDPPVLRVNRGDRITVRLLATDVTHGFYLEGYDLDAKVRPENDTFWIRHPLTDGEHDWTEVKEFTFTASRTGKFRYRCSLTCGYMHPFMQGEMIVQPNYLYKASLGLSMALMLGVLVVFRLPGEGEQS